MSTQTQTAAPSTASTTSVDPRPGEPAPEALPDNPQIVVRGGEDLVTAVPHLIGFPPERSLVAVAVNRDGARSVLGVVARFDLPTAAGPRKQQREGTAAATRVLVGQVVEVLQNDRAKEVVVLVYDQGPCGAPPPWQRLVDRLDAALRAAGIPVLDALFVTEPRFRSYRCVDYDCCPAEGLQVDPGASEIASRLLARGRAPMRSRAELRAVVQPSDVERCIAVEVRARQQLEAVGWCWAEEQKPAWRSWQLESLRLLAGVAARRLRGHSSLSEEEAGRVLAGLCDVTVRDAAAVLFTRWAQRGEGDDRPDDAGECRMAELLAAVRADDGDEPREGPAADERAERLQSLWVELATSCDGPLAAAPLTLLGMHVWSRGNGTLAAAAVDRALAVDPEYRLAVLLDRALSVGMRPASLRRVSELETT